MGRCSVQFVTFLQSIDRSFLFCSRIFFSVRYYEKRKKKKNNNCMQISVRKITFYDVLEITGENFSNFLFFVIRTSPFSFRFLFFFF